MKTLHQTRSQSRATTYAATGPAPAAQRRPPSTGDLAMRAAMASAPLRPRAGSSMPAPGDNRSRIALARQLQHMHGNRAVGRWLRATGAAPPDRIDLASEPAPRGNPSSVGTTPLPVPASPSVTRGSAARSIQRDATDDSPWWQAVSFGETVAWQMVDQLAPQLSPILRKGPEGLLDWLKDRASQAAGAAFQALTSPVRAVAGVGAQLSALYTPLLATLQASAAKIAVNDCSPISQAANQIEATAEKIITPLIAKVQPVVATIQDCLAAAWNKVGAPVWEWIKDYASQQWDLVKQLGSWIWQLTGPMRSLGGDAWNWLKNKLGIGDGPEGENGVLQWVQARLAAAWDRISVTLEPFGKQLAIVRAALGQVSNVFTSQIAKLTALFGQIGKGIRWFATNLADGASVVTAHGYVSKTLIPPLTEGLRSTGVAVIGMAGGLAGALGQVATGVNNAASLLSTTALRFAAPLVQWLADEAAALAGWSTAKLGSVTNWLDSTLERFESFLHGLADFLSRVGNVAANVWALPAMLAGKVWQAIPACIRDPVVDFIVPIMLKQIELFSELVRDNDAWQKTKTQAMGILRRVFVNHDLAGALKASFQLVLRVLNIPEDMLGKVAAKAMAAWDVVSRQPLEFIKNTVRSLGHGFKLLGANIVTHLEHGVEGWLFGELGDKDVRPPASWTEPMAILGFVVDVLGLSMSHVTEVLKQRIDPKLVNRVQLWIGRFSRAWDWITSVIRTSKSPAENTQGLIAQAKDFGKSILTGVAEWIAGKVAEELAMLGAAAAASGGLSEVLDVARRIYKAMLTAKRWAARILQMASDTLDNVLDIAGGNVAKVGGEFQKIMDKAMPVVIGFLADQVGLGGIGAALRGIIDKLQQQVDAALLWLIDKVKAGIEALLGGIKTGVAALTDWWTQRTEFKTRDGTPHALYLKGGSQNGELTVESSPMPVFAFLDKVLAMLNDSATDKKIVNELRPKHAAALKAARKVDQTKTELQEEANARDPSKVLKMNKDMNALADLIEPLIAVMYPDTRGAVGLEINAWIRLFEVHDQLARVTGFSEMQGLTMVEYNIVNPKAIGWYRGKNPEGGAAGAGKLNKDMLNITFEVAEVRARDVYMGDNPDRNSEEGRELYLMVARKMRGHNKAYFRDGVESVPNIIVRYNDDEYPIDACHLSHIIDAQAWWNSNGRTTAPQAAVVRAFMEDPDNYELEPKRPNLSRGGGLSKRETRYRPPVR